MTNDWFHHLDRKLQRSLKADPDRSLEPDEVAAIFTAGGTAIATKWESSPAYTWALPASVIEFVEALEDPSSEFGFWDPEGRWNANSQDW